MASKNKKQLEAEIKKHLMESLQKSLDLHRGYSDVSDSAGAKSVLRKDLNGKLSQLMDGFVKNIKKQARKDFIESAKKHPKVFYLEPKKKKK